jgi:hypothetical protein
MANNSQAGAAVGTGERFATKDIGTDGTGIVKLPSVILASGGSSGAAADITLTNALPVAIASLNYPQSSGNNSTAQLGAGATFTGTIETVLSMQAAQIEIVCDQPYTLIVEQFIDLAGTKKSSKDSDYTFTRLAGVPTNENITLPGNYFRIKVTNNGGSPTTTLQIDTTFGIMNTGPYTLTNLGNSKVSVNELNGTAIDTNSGNKSAGTQRMVIATDQPNLTTALNVAGGKTNNNAAPGATNLGTLPVLANAAVPTWVEGNQTALSADLSGRLRTDNSTVAGTVIATGNGVVSAGVQRVAIASDNTAFSVNASGTKTNNNAAPGATNVGVLPSVATAAAPSSTEGNQVAISMNLTGDQRCISKISDGTTTAAVIAGTTALKTDLSSVAGTATVTAAAGVQRVGIAGNANAALDSATGSAVPANALLTGCRVATSNPANAASGNNVAAMADKAGRQVVTVGQIRELVGVQQTAIAATGETTVVTAGGAGVFNDIVGIIITTAGAAAQTITIKDATAGTTRFVLNYPNAAIAPGNPLRIMFPVAVPQAAANSNWTVTQSLATSCNYTFLFNKNL